MNVSIETLTVLLYLTPGLFASMLLDLILVRKERDGGSRIVEALVFSLVIYGVAWLLIGRFPVTVSNAIDTSGRIINRTIVFESGAIVPSIIATLVLPLLVGHLLTAQWLMRMLRRFRITGRTGRESTWLDVFLDQKRYIIVNLIDGRRLFGWPQYYSDNRDEGMLYLSDVAWYDDQGQPQEPNMHGIFLVKKDSIDFIEFTHIEGKNVKDERRRTDQDAKNRRKQGKQPT